MRQILRQDIYAGEILDAQRRKLVEKRIEDKNHLYESVKQEGKTKKAIFIYTIDFAISRNNNKTRTALLYSSHDSFVDIF